MTKQTPEKRNARLSTKIRPSIKAAAEKAAQDEGRTLSNYIENLIIEKMNEKN